MGTISASNGLNTGIDITGTITKLMAISARPRDAIATANTHLTNQETALAKLSALLLGVRGVTQSFGQASVWASQSAASSDPSSLTATVTGTPVQGTYQYTPLRTAQTQQYLSSGFQSTNGALGGGTITFRYGTSVDQGVSLANLNGGQGFSAGKIRVTDRGGASVVINLSDAQNIDEVLQAINTNGTVNVTASVQNGHIVLTDNTGQSSSDLKVQEVNGGTTAASLGLSGIDAAANSAAGQDIFKLSSNLSLSALNDGAGVQTNTALPDIQYTLHDGTSGTIDLSPIIPGGSTVQKESNLGDIINEMNTQAGGKLKVSISSDGQHLVVTDTTAAANPSGTLSISNDTGSTAASDLGLVVNSASAGAVTGSQILGGLKTVLLSSLNGGQGLGTLGYMKLTDANGIAVNVNLSGSVTLQDVVDKINSQVQANNAQNGAPAVGITAAVNAAGNGIQLTDSTGATSGTLTAANSNSANDGGSDGLNTAVKLGFATQTAPGSSSSGVLNGGDLHLRTVSRNTLLSTYNGGAGVGQGNFQITDTAGITSSIRITSSMTMIGDVIDAINRNTTGIRAAINATGDGIVLQDTAHGSGTLSIAEGDSTTAHDLNLLAVETSDGGVQTINGTTTHTITLSATDSLTTLQDNINNLGAGLSAGIVRDGSGKPYRLSLTAMQSGQAGNMVVDTSQLSGLSLQEMSHGQDALLALGNASGSKNGSSSGSVVISSSSNTFTGVLPGVTLQVRSGSGQSVSISVANDGTNIAASLQSFVTNYNTFRAELTTDTAYNTTTNTGSVLSDDGSALQLDWQLSQLLTTSFNSSGSMRSLADVGVTIQSDGTLSFDENQFNTAWAFHPAAVQQMFTTKTTGISDRLSTLISQLAGTTNSTLSSRISALKQQIADNQQTIDQMNQRLTDEQNRLYTSFYNMDLTIGKLKNTQSLISNIFLLTPNTGVTVSK
jgi:flagellar hook-associated protein 2